MNIHTKKIIAREGLILLALVIISSILFSFYLFITDKVYSFNDEWHIYKISLETEKDFIFPAKNKEHLSQQIEKANLENVKEQNEIDQLFKNDFAIAREQRIYRRLEKYLLYSLSFVAFAVYPLYLIIRFIIWAIKTLKL